MAEPFILDHLRDHNGGSGSAAGRKQGVRKLPSYNELVARYVKRPVEVLTPLLVTVGIVLALAYGWVHSDEGHLTPESGTGYWLGIIGASAMMLLLVYPMRKRVPSLRFLGSVPFWFRFHMLLGIFGPLLIVFHSNFKLGALNSNVAFISMLIVAGSGVVGRYIYGKIHMGLNGHKAAVRDILDDAARMQQALDNDLEGGSRIIAQMSEFSVAAMTPRPSALGSMFAMFGLALRAMKTKRRLRRQLHSVIATEANVRGWSRKQRRQRENEANDLVALYFAAMGKAAKFGFYERLFALWHVLHLPLFFLLIAAVLVHILAVHLY